MDKSKLTLIVGIVLIVVALGVSIFAISMMKDMMKSNNGEENQTEEDETIIPLEQREDYQLSEAIIGTFKKVDSDGNKKTMNVNIEIGFSFDMNNKEYADKLALMGTKENILRDRISKLLDDKSYDFMDSNESTVILQQEILEIAQTLFDTESIIEVYFGKNLKSIR